MKLGNGNNFELMYRNDGVYLRVLFGDTNNLISKNDLLYLLKRKKIEDLDIDAVSTLYNSSSGGEGIIAPSQKEVYIDDEINVTVSKDCMEAEMVIYKGEEKGARLNLDDTLDIISRDYNIVYGINKNAVEEMISNRVYDRPMVIAAGTPAVNGINGKINYNFETTFNKIGEEVDGRIDFKKLNLFANVTRGSVLATKTAPTHGTDGFDVYGNTLPAKPGSEAKFFYGKNVFPSDDGNTLLAGIDGKADLVGNKIVVSKVYAVNGNVDMSVGNIDFAGDVIVNGNVMAGFEIKAGGSVEVYGIVEGAHIVAKENVRIAGSFLGNGHGMVEAGGSVFCKSVEHGVIKAVISIEADVVMHSNLYCEGVIKVCNEKSSLIGGNTCSGKEIILNNAGSVKGTTTNLRIEFPADTFQQINDAEEEKRKLTTTLKGLEELKQKALGSNGIDMKKKLSIMNSIVSVKQSIDEVAAKSAKLEQMVENVRNGKIQIRGRAYNGVDIYINNMIKRIDLTVDYTTYVCRDGEIKGFPCS